MSTLLTLSVEINDIHHQCVCVCVFQTVQSEQPLSEEGGAKLNASSVILEESQRIHKEAKGLFTRHPQMKPSVNMNIFKLNLNLSACPDQQLDVSMVTSRLQLVRDRARQSSLLLRDPVRELQTLSNGETLKG